MKKIFSIIIAMCMITSFASAAFAADKEFVISDGGNSVHTTIVVRTLRNTVDVNAASAIAKAVKAITGETMSIVEGSYTSYDSCIAIGSASYLGMDEPKHNGYIIKSAPNGIKIAGAGERGTIEGAYAFLEKYCGCHWYAVDCITYPEVTELKVPGNISYEYTPFFEYTETDGRSSKNVEYRLANGNTGGVYCSIPESYGGTVTYYPTLCHTLSTLFCSTGNYFSTHPEYFALRNGERLGVNTQLCLTNPDVVKIVTDETLNYIKTYKEQHGGQIKDLLIVSLTQADDYNQCQCDKCKASDEYYGSPAGTMINFVNQVAEKVTEAGYTDNVVIDTFAYQYTRPVPKNIKPRENVAVRLCSIECCFGHALNDSSCSENRRFMEDLQGWSKISNRLYIWDYVNNYAHTANIFPDFGVLQSNVQTFYENNAVGIYEEGNYYYNQCDAEFGDLRTYVLSRLLQDPYCDYEKEMLDFCNAFYGPGGKYIKEFIDITSECATKGTIHSPIYQDAGESLPGMTGTRAKYCNKLWEQAKAAAEGNQTFIDRIERSELSWRYWKASNPEINTEFSHWKPIWKWGKEYLSLYEDMVNRFGITRLSEGGGELTDSRLIVLTSKPCHWTKGFQEQHENDLIRKILVKIIDFVDNK